MLAARLLLAGVWAESPTTVVTYGALGSGGKFASRGGMSDERALRRDTWDAGVLSGTDSSRPPTPPPFAAYTHLPRWHHKM